MNFEENGFLILREIIKKEDLIKIRNEVTKSFFSQNKIKIIKNLDLNEAHKLVEQGNVKYLSMGYETKEINKKIKELSNKTLTAKISERINKKLTFEEGASIITLFPEELSGYNVHYHQDEDVKNKKPNRIHVITPLSEQKLTLIKLLDSTHNIGTFNHILFGPLIRIEDSRLEQYLKKEVTIDLNFGDVLIFYTSLIHKVEDNKNSDCSHWMLRFILKHD
ncbi:hypothetical protein HG263_04845 [Pseudoalteromonas sp. JBTF-M23]|uniref:Phytanoyl-CoA dioxygenase PhyH n=1 Tax=Pseudoalteromonas caenipelagi TaxID=2726988 RepID=A0A849V949_9GAMM|nr:hypothetical protein [Pseudoalteromonas caenipelagi]NOU49862.1 hypothetical protein [Pseudoalteromonas caenipelagi]